MERSELRIGKIAVGAGVSVDTVRYYERLKLLPRARRTSGNFRVFASNSVERVHFIKQAPGRVGGPKHSGLDLRIALCQL